MDSHETCFSNSLGLLLELFRIYSPGAIFWGPFWSQIVQNSGFNLFCKKLHSLETYFLSSLELIIEVRRIWASRTPWAQWGRICPGHILETTGQIFMIRKPHEMPLAICAHWLGHFPLIAPRGLQRAQGLKSSMWFDKCGQILGWFSPVWYIEAKWRHSVPDLFLPEASFGPQVLSLPASVCPSVRQSVHHQVFPCDNL